jgi:hypothetical protein
MMRTVRGMAKTALMARMGLIATLAACAGARGTTLMHMSVAKMTGAADLIARARCIGNATGWDEGEIWTFTAFETEEVWKGAAAARITVRLLGGRAGNLTSSVAGVPRFQAGEEVVLFLEATGRGDYSIVSWVQGTFRIRLDPRTGRESAVQDTADFATFDPATRRFEANGIRNVPLDALRAQVDAARREQAGRKP